MKMLVLACTEFGTNRGRVTLVVVIPFPVGAPTPTDDGV